MWRFFLAMLAYSFFSAMIIPPISSFSFGFSNQFSTKEKFSLLTAKSKVFSVFLLVMLFSRETILAHPLVFYRLEITFYSTCQVKK
jgi:hypothetical protein